MSEKIVQLNEEIIKSELKELVRGSVEETLNELLNNKAYVHIEVGGTARYRAGAIHTSTWTASTCAAIGVESTKMWPFWWQLP